MTRPLVGDTGDGTSECRLPWGSQIRVRTNDHIGREILQLGVFDLSVCECIARLTKPGTLALDVGANCGQMTSLMAYCVGSAGRVLAFEPHPKIFCLLEANLLRWNSVVGWGQTVARQVALGKEPGAAELIEPLGFESNSGLATLANKDAEGTAHRVQVVTLDSVLDGSQEVSVFKLDVEGFEKSVLDGAKGALSQGKVRNIVFEENAPKSSVVFETLREHGYEVFSVRARKLGFEILPVHKIDGPQVRTSNFLATLDPQMVENAFRRPGYAALKRPS